MQAMPPAFLGHGMLHHEGLHRHRTPGIKNRQAQGGIPLLQLLLCPDQPLAHTPTQTEGIGPLAVGGTEALIGMGTEAMENGWERLQWFAALMDRTLAPGPGHHSRAGNLTVAFQTLVFQTLAFQTVAFNSTDRLPPLAEADPPGVGGGSAGSAGWDRR
jgi:hypothetical protein